MNVKVTKNLFCVVTISVSALFFLLPINYQLNAAEGELTVPIAAVKAEKLGSLSPAQLAKVKVTVPKSWVKEGWLEVHGDLKSKPKPKDKGARKETEPTFKPDPSPKVDPSDVPPEVPHSGGYVNTLVPPEGFHAGLAWMQAIQDDEEGSSEVKVDWMKFYALVNGYKTLLAKDDYGRGKGVAGALFRRTRGDFGSTKLSKEIPQRTFGSYAILRISTHPDKVWHWWSSKWPRARIPVGTERCWMEARVKISGPALVQVGIDFWRTPRATDKGYGVNNIEAGVSEWYGASEEWQIISVGKKD